MKTPCSSSKLFIDFVEIRESTILCGLIELDQRDILLALCYKMSPLTKSSGTDPLYHFLHSTIFASGNMQLMVCYLVLVNILELFCCVTETSLWK